MKFTHTDLPGVVLVEPDVHRDERGFFLESFHAEKYAEGGITEPFVQDNHSLSSHGTLRGIHAQLRRSQGKLVRVLEGEVFDVAVDIRRGSPHFGEWVGYRLSAENFLQLYVPPGFGHAFCVLSDRAQFEYKCTNFYDPESEITIAWNDPEIGIEWPLDAPLLSAKDSKAPTLQEVLERLPRFVSDS